jgi:adenylate kinase
MRVILLGPPGSGKGTQATLLSQRLHLRHFSTGDILREAIQKNTEEGKLAQPYVSAGRLVPDDVVNEIVTSRFRADDRPDSFVMDGYPRTVEQADTFRRVLTDQGIKLHGAVLLVVSDEEIIDRLSGRRTCPNPTCGASYHLRFNPPKKRAGHCDLCGTALVQRDDDRAETVAQRLAVYHRTHDALVEHYRKRGLLIEIPGSGDIEAIYAGIVEALRARTVK